MTGVNLVSNRSQEIGLRMALGSQLGDVPWPIQSVVCVVFGILLGLFAAFGLTRMMAHLLCEVGATEPSSFVFVTPMLVAVAFVASYTRRTALRESIR